MICGTINDDWVARNSPTIKYKLEELQNFILSMVGLLDPNEILLMSEAIKGGTWISHSKG